MKHEDGQNWTFSFASAFLAEETGEVARAIRSLEIGRDRPDEVIGSYEENKQELTEELGDVIGSLIVIENKYNIPLEVVFNAHKKKHLNAIIMHKFL
ncbi:hypothetical protein SRABI96_05054 [Peribacillus sp. Bi96]|nr:hypothetical protein SRABI96_05054 [Peribacillus sp. Bi96]